MSGCQPSKILAPATGAVYPLVSPGGVFSMPLTAQTGDAATELPSTDAGGGVRDQPRREDDLLRRGTRRGGHLDRRAQVTPDTSRHHLT